MPNHPNRSQIRFPARLLDIDGSPSPDWVLGRRINCKTITQQQAADMLYVDLRTYQRWEYGDRQMHPAMWALFLIRTERYIRPEQRASWYGKSCCNEGLGVL